MYGIRRLNGAINSKRLMLSLTAVIAISAPALLLAMMLIQPYGGRLRLHAVLHPDHVRAACREPLILISARKRFGISQRWVTAALLLLIAVPFAWQMMMVFRYLVAKFNGYRSDPGR